MINKFAITTTLAVLISMNANAFVQSYLSSPKCFNDSDGVVKLKLTSNRLDVWLNGLKMVSDNVQILTNSNTAKMISLGTDGLEFTVIKDNNRYFASFQEEEWIEDAVTGQILETTIVEVKTEFYNCY